MDLFVSNLNYATTDIELRALFERFGAVSRCHVVKDKDTGQGRGFAFVTMTDGVEARRAIIALNRTELAGRNIRVARSAQAAS